jgi:hypothetical protein
MCGPCWKFTGDNKGRLRVVAAEKPWAKNTKSWEYKDENVACP